MIKNIQLKNFKSFKKAGNIDIGKINVFVGPNSSGKSSFIQGLLLLKNAIQCVVDENYKGLEGDYRSLVYDKDTHNKLQYKMSFNEDEQTKESIDKSIIEEDFPDISKEEIAKIKEYYEQIKLIDMSVTLRVADDSNNNILNTDGLEINTFEVTTKCNLKVVIFIKDEQYRLKLNGIEIDDLDISNTCKFYFKMNKKSFVGDSEKLKNEIFLTYSILEKLESTLINFSSKIIYMASLRTDFLRSENIGKDDKTSRVGSRGQHTLSALMDIDRCCEKNCEIKYKKAKIDYWLDEFDLGDKIEVKKMGTDKYSIMIRNKYLDIYSNILDVGIGTSQLLPLIIESVNSANDSFIIIEEPETHIHPKAQAKLSDLFVGCANDDNKKFIIETHSIFLVTQLQILIASGEIAAEDVKVYFFDQDEEGTNITNMILSKNGQFEDEWPSGFFDIHYELGKKLFELM